MSDDVVIVGACRTAIGRHGGALKTVDAVNLTIPVMQELINGPGSIAGLIEDVIWGCNYQKTYKENNLAQGCGCQSRPSGRCAGNNGSSELHFFNVSHTDGLLSDQGR